MQHIQWSAFIWLGTLFQTKASGYLMYIYVKSFTFSILIDSLTYYCLFKSFLVMSKSNCHQENGRLLFNKLGRKDLNLDSTMWLFVICYLLYKSLTNWRRISLNNQKTGVWSDDETDRDKLFYLKLKVWLVYISVM